MDSPHYLKDNRHKFFINFFEQYLYSSLALRKNRYDNAVLYKAYTKQIIPKEVNKSWGSKPSGTWRCGIGWEVSNVSKKCDAFIFNPQAWL